MNMWKEETLRFLQLALQQPGRLPLLIATASVVALVFIVLLRFVSAAFRITNAGWLQRLTATVLVLTLPLAATVATSLYVCPRMATDTLKLTALIAGPVLALLLIAIPLATLTLSARYFQTLGAIVLCLAGAWGAVLLTNAMINAVNEGSRQAGKAVERKSDIKQILK